MSGNSSSEIKISGYAIAFSRPSPYQGFGGFLGLCIGIYMDSEKWAREKMGWMWVVWVGICMDGWTSLHEGSWH